MDTNSGVVGFSRVALWSGRVLGFLVALLMIFSAVMKLLKPAKIVEGFAHFGYPESTIIPLGIAELVCAILYLIPQTSVLGAVLLTGYLGGATATNLRVGDAYFPPVIVGIVAWGALFLRDRRLRALLPLTTCSSKRVQP